MLAHSPTTYPEISAKAFMTAIINRQTPREKNLLPAARIELAFIRTTRADDGRGMKGTLCRGELLEIVLRMVWAPHDQKKNYAVAPHVQGFIDRVFMPMYKESTFVQNRKLIRKSSKLNQLLYHNSTGLRMIFCERKIWHKVGKTQD